MPGPINGMIRAANALHYWGRRQEIVANNLANAETTGFKAERVFARMMGDSIPVADSATDLTNGTIRETGSPLDLALSNDGFFVVDTPNGERLTRGGSFTLDAAGQIVDANGNALLGENGPIAAPAGTIEIDKSGVVRVNGAEVDTLRVETVPANVRLMHDAGTHFLPNAAQAPQAAADRQVRQGALEESNVGTIDSMVDLISVQRAYAAVQRAVTTLDGIRDTISNQLGKPV
ncbi:MAG: flagellar hook basal-body protein [Gemmatimonadetes bacterium]|nr:flagellar hook basal-body protein [Gemmatimonadota bacterium]